MGWWGISSATPEQEAEFERNYEEKFIKQADPGMEIDYCRLSWYIKLKEKDKMYNLVVVFTDEYTTVEELLPTV